MPEPDHDSLTGARASQQVLKGERDAFASVFEQSPIPMLLCDVGTLSILAANQLAAQLHASTPEQLVGRSLFELRSVSDLTSVMLKRAVGREIALGFGYHTRHDGSVFPVQLSVHPSELGGRPCWLCVLKSLEDAFAPTSEQRQQRLDEAIGRLAAGMAHDVNNALSVILSCATLASSQLPEQQPARADLREICAAAERAALLTKQLISLSRRTPASPKPLSLNDVVTRLEKLLARLLDGHATLEISLESPLHLVLADTSSVERLLIQLVSEVKTASRPGSRLLIETKNAVLDTDWGEREHVLLRISDSGAGITAELAASVLEPMVSTGWLETEPEAGARFVVCFPRFEQSPMTDQTKSQPDERDQTVLVVQDNPHLRKTLKTYFARQGYHVLDADSIIEATRLAETASGIDLLLTDFSLTDGSGTELSELLATNHPKLRTLVTIDYPEQRAAVRDDNRTAVLSKPFDLRQFGERVSDLLAQARG